MMDTHIHILAVDQARNCGWSVWDYDNKTIVKYGTLKYGPTISFEEMIYTLTRDLWDIVCNNNVDAVFFEDTQYQMNIDSFKKLCWLQGGLIHWLSENDILYSIIPPSRWQGYCNARGRSSSEVKSNIRSASDTKKRGKALTIEYVREQYGIDTNDDNLADAICIGFYVVNNIELKKRSN